MALEEEFMLLKCEHDIQKQVREKIDKNQKDYFLREQIKALQSELGEYDEDDEIKEYDDKIAAATMPEEIKDKLYKELSKLAKTPFGAAEGTVIRAYLDTCLDYPFGKKTKEAVTVEDASELKLAVVFRVIESPADIPEYGTIYQWQNIADWKVD